MFLEEKSSTNITSIFRHSIMKHLQANKENLKAKKSQVMNNQKKEKEG